MERIRSLEELEKCMEEEKFDYKEPEYLVPGDVTEQVRRGKLKNVDYTKYPSILGEIFIHNKVIELEDCDLLGKDGYIIIFSSCVFNHCKIPEKTIRNLIFMHCDFVICDFSSASIYNCKFKYCNFQFSKFVSTYVKCCRVEFSHVDCCNMENSNLDNSVFWCSDLYSEFINFKMTKLDHSKIKKCSIQYCYTKNASTDDVELYEVYINPKEYNDMHDEKLENMWATKEHLKPEPVKTDNKIETKTIVTPVPPEVGAFIGFMRRRVYLKNKDFYATIKVQITENSKREHHHGKCACSEFIPLEIYTIELDEQDNIKRIPADKDTKIAIGTIRYKVGEKIKLPKGYYEDGFNGFPFYLSEKDALGFSGLVLKERLNGKCS
jgi:uncharacterized protein YjbI with pentapeptide repeats